MKLRTRFAITTVSVSSVLLLATAVTAPLLTHQQLRNRAESDLVNLSNRVMRSGTTGSNMSTSKACGVVARFPQLLASDQTTHAVVLNRSGHKQCSSLTPPAAFVIHPGETLTDGFPTAQQLSDGSHALIFARPLADGGRLVLVHSIEDDRATVRLISMVLGLILLAGLVTSAIAGAAAATAATTPIERLISYVRGRVNGDTARDPAEIGTSDTALLAASFDDVFERMESMAALQRQLVIDAAHELRTPLTSAVTNTQVAARMARTHSAEDELPQVLDDVLTQVQSLSAIVDDLVDAASIEERALHALHLEPQPLAPIVVEAVSRAARLHPRHEVVVEHTDAAERHVDASLLGRALLNLIDNAVKFSPPASTIVLCQHGGTISVADAGPGFDDAEIDLVFQPFHRARTAQHHSGSGLGLALVARVADLHGGTASAANQADGGGIVTITLPETPPADS